ncbi:GTPase IMAP family member 8-like [Cebidichthys violaceus]|uniref:GTPase IMAP family member 8-like n=1 Tax=Cebidichthys violaceus TaxID=271503 RepID=UPI0035CB9BF1
MDPGLTIVLLGNSGVGKSASGNTILGRPAFESKRSFISVTKQISEATETVFEKQISVIDTPGILGSEGEVQTQCQDLLKSSRPCLFLVVVKIDRFTIEQKNTVEKAIRAVGDQDFNKCYLLFTGGDYLNNQSLDDFINEDPEGPLPPLVERFAGRHHVFNNENGGPEQVRELLVKSGHLRITGVSKERRIVLLGLPGAGKSSSGNTILGSDKFKSGCGFDSVSTKTVSQSAIVEGCKVTVVDTPGFTDKVLTPEQLYLEIMKMTVTASPGPHAFVFVVRIGRLTNADIQLFELLPKLFNSDALRYSMILFTYGDELKDQNVDLIQSNPQVSDLVSLCGGRYCVFDNRAKTNREQVRTFLSKVDEMVTANGGQHFTNDTFKMAETVLDTVKKRFFNLKDKAKNLIDKAWEIYIPDLMNSVGREGVGAVVGALIGAVIGGVVGGVVGRVAGAAAGIGIGAVAGALVGAGAGAVVGAGAGAGPEPGPGLGAEPVGTGAGSGSGSAAIIEKVMKQKKQ